MEIDLAKALKKYETCQSEKDFLKEKNVELYDLNIALEEQVSLSTTTNKVLSQPSKSDTAHLQEMMDAQMLLREEMKGREELYQRNNELQEIIKELQTQLETQDRTYKEDTTSL